MQNGSKCHERLYLGNLLQNRHRIRFLELLFSEVEHWCNYYYHKKQHNNTFSQDIRKLETIFILQIIFSDCHIQNNIIYRIR